MRGRVFPTFFRGLADGLPVYYKNLDFAMVLHVGVRFCRFFLEPFCLPDGKGAQFPPRALAAAPPSGQSPPRVGVPRFRHHPLRLAHCTRHF